jgi:hypothetical protein
MTSTNKWFARNVDMVTMSKNASMWWLWQIVPHVLSLPCPCDTLVLSYLFSHCFCLWYVDLPYLQSFVFFRKIEVCPHEFYSIVYTQIHDQTNKFDSRFLDEIILHKWIQVLGILIANNAWIGLKHVFQQVRLIESLSKLMFSNWYESTHSITYHVIFLTSNLKILLRFLCAMGKCNSIIQN